MTELRTLIFGVFAAVMLSPQIGRVEVIVDLLPEALNSFLVIVNYKNLYARLQSHEAPWVMPQFAPSSRLAPFREQTWQRSGVGKP